MKGKALEKFEEWYFEKYGLGFHQLPLVCQQALWVEFLIEYNKELFENIFYNEYRRTGFKDYKTALSKAFEKATEIFNNQSK